MSLLIGCAELPSGMSRKAYFKALPFLEVESSRRQLPKVATARKWKSPSAHLAIHAPSELCVDFAEGPLLESFARVLEASEAEVAVFRTAPNFAPSQRNRDLLRAFFGEGGLLKALPEAVKCVWQPMGLWEPEIALNEAETLNLLVAFDPLSNDLEGEIAGAVERAMSQDTVYFRVVGKGRAGRRLDQYQLEELAGMAHEAEGWMSIASPEKFRDAKELTKLLGE